MCEINYVPSLSNPARSLLRHMPTLRSASLTESDTRQSRQTLHSSLGLLYYINFTHQKFASPDSPVAILH